MKKLLSIILSIVMLLSITAGMSVSVYAGEEDFAYKVTTNGNAVITGYIGSDTSLTIPTMLGGYQVTGIDEYAFYYESGIRSVTIPGSIQTIARYAFCFCNDLTSVTLFKGIKSIDKYAFNRCESLYSVNYTGTKAEWHSLSDFLYYSDEYYYTIVCSDGRIETADDFVHTYVTTIKKATPKSSGYVDHKCKYCNDNHYKYLPQVYAKLSKKKYYYSGKAKKPKVTVYNENGSTISKEHYKVVYPKGRKKIGKYTVKIIFKGAYYSGTIKKTFKIVKKVKKPAQVKGVKATVLIDNDNSTVPFNVKWKKVKGASGYQMKFGNEDGGGKYWSGTKTFKGASNTTFNTMLLYGTDICASKYGCSFLKIRAYKKVNGKKVYGKWSKIVNCKTYEKTNGKTKEKLY